MLPPVLEVYVVWHPGDPGGTIAAEQVFQHFHGTLFSGLIGGAVEVYVRSAGWRAIDDAPRPIPFPSAPPPNGIVQAQLTAVVPVLGNEFAAAVETGPGPWRAYASGIVAAHDAAPDRVGVFPLLVDHSATDNTELGRIFSRRQRIAASGPPAEPEEQLRCRDLAQAIAQMAGAGERLTVFISHTKHGAEGEQDDVPALIEQVRRIIGRTRLREFFDAHDLQPGCDWDKDLRAQAATSALLALRTDLYAGREWCQREVLIAKQHGMPIVILDALGRGEERGSFLMDHVPRVPVRHDGPGWRDTDIRLGLNLLVDECLKRALWRRQADLARDRADLDVAWWAPHAPEPVTLAHWLTAERASGRPAGAGDLRVLHPDPPLGPAEREVLDQMAALGGFDGRFDPMTPRMLAARGG